MPKTILILEDNEERIADFGKAVTQLGDGYELKIWRDAHSMRSECESFFRTAALVCGTLSGRRTVGHGDFGMRQRRQTEPAVLVELEDQREHGRNTAAVVELLRPMPLREVSSTGLWAMAVAFYLFVHGLPLLAVGAMPHDPEHSASHSSPAEQAKMERLVRPVIRALHISNENQLRMLFWLPGGLLTAAAIGVSLWGDKRQSRQTKETNRTYDLELEKITSAEHIFAVAQACQG